MSDKLPRMDYRQHRRARRLVHECFFKQKTAYEIYQCDWSSDVCSSDLPHGLPPAPAGAAAGT